MTTETEEVNTHGFDNTEGTEHAVGVYRWLDKLYQGQVKNYGKRLMFEMVVPEPAAFHKYAKSQPRPGAAAARAAGGGLQLRGHHPGEL